MPKNLFMVEKDTANEVSDGYKYKITFKKYKNPKSIRPEKYSRLNTPERLLATLFYAYQKQSKKELIALFSPAARKVLEKLTEEQFKQQLDIVKDIKDPRLDYAFIYKEGIVMSWKDSSFQKARKIYIKDDAGSYQISSFHADNDDAFFWNVNMYVAGYPFLYKSPNLLESFKKINDSETKKLAFKVNKKGNYVHLFKEFDSPVNLSLKDNHKSQYAKIVDNDEAEQIINVNLQGKNFSQSGKTKLYYIETNYPVSFIPKSQKKNVKSITIEKIKSK